VSATFRKKREARNKRIFQERRRRINKRLAGTDQQIGASFDRFERAISAVLMLASSSEAHF